MFNMFKKLLGGGADLSEVVAKGAVVIDVRTVQEYSQGHGQSKNIPLDKLPTQIEKIRKMGKPIITCCASGMRSATAASMLKREGIEAYNGGPWHKADQLLNA